MKFVLEPILQFRNRIITQEGSLEVTYLSFIPTCIPQNSVLQDINRCNGEKVLNKFGKGKHLHIQYDEVHYGSPLGKFFPNVFAC